jgi:hypothetical protein
MDDANLLNRKKEKQKSKKAKAKNMTYYQPLFERIQH